jgi:heat shock protein 4
MLDQLEKTRKILSDNSEAVVNIECLLEDKNLHKNLTREEFENLVQSNIEELQKLCEKVLQECNLKDTDID